MRRRCVFSCISRRTLVPIPGSDGKRLASQRLTQLIFVLADAARIHALAGSGATRWGFRGCMKQSIWKGCLLPVDCF